MEDKIEHKLGRWSAYREVLQRIIDFELLEIGKMTDTPFWRLHKCRQAKDRYDMLAEVFEALMKTYKKDV